MKFAHPQFLYLLFLAPALVGWFLWSGRQRRRQIQAFGNPELLARIGSAVNPPRRRLKQGFLVLAVVFLVLALARPQWGASLKPIKREGVDLVVVVDVSLSMLAQDIKPNRLEKAKHELAKLLDLLRGDRVAIVAFAGTSFTLCPLTLDYQAAKMFLQTLHPGAIPEPGTALADAIRTGASNFDPKSKKFKAMILLTDGENLREGEAEDPVAAAEKAGEEGVVIYTVGIGSTRGEPIPLTNEAGEVAYKRDANGQPVMTKLDEETLQKIALAAGGKYYHATPEEMELGKIYEAISGMEKKTFEEQYQVQYEDRFQWPLLLAVLLLFAEAVLPEGRRRSSAEAGVPRRSARRPNGSARSARVALSAGALLLLGLGGPVVEKTREGNRAYATGQYERAQSLYVEARAGVEEKSEAAYRLHLNLGDALYQQRKYAEARQEFEQAGASESVELQAQAAYNIGNTYFREAMQSQDPNAALELLKQAVAAYRKTLELNPEDEDAKYNLEVVRRHLDLKQQPPPPSPSPPRPQAGDTAKPPEEKEPTASQQPQPQSGGTGEQKPEPGAGGQKPRAELSREEAERLLEAMQAQEEEQQKERFRRSIEGRPGGKDW